MNQSLIFSRLILLCFVLIIKSHHARLVTENPHDPTALITFKFINAQNNNQPAPTINPQALINSPISTTFPSENQDTIESSETIVYNRYTDLPSNYKDYSSSEEDSEEPSDHAIPYSEHEEPKNVSTRPKYEAPGNWAKPSKDKQVRVDFVPTKLHTQVRGTHTVRRLPRKKAIESATTKEEKENAARLREVVSNSKVNTVYTEEGYEDSAYDHAGHIRDADFHEGFARKLHDQMDVKKKSKNVGDNEEENATRDNRGYEKIDPTEFKEYDDDYRGHYETTTSAGRLFDTTDGSRNVEDNANVEWARAVNPKLATEHGIERLQEDLDKETKEMERIEIKKLKEAELSSENNDDQGASSNYDRDRKRRRKMKRKRTKAPLRISENYPRDSARDSSTVRPFDEKSITTDYIAYETSTSLENLQDSVDYTTYSPRYAKYPTDYVSSGVDSHLTSDDKPTTVKHSDIFWNYYKSRQKHATTVQAPIVHEPTTSSPLYARVSGTAAYTNEPYVVENVKSTTESAIVEFETLRPERLVSGSSEPENVNYPPSRDAKTFYPHRDNYRLNNNAYHSVANEENSWQPVQETPEHYVLSEALDSDYASTTPRIITTVLQEDPEGKDEEPDIHDDYHSNSLYSTTAHSYDTNRRPPYRVLVRYKPKKPFKFEYARPETSTESPTKDKLSQIPSPENLRKLNENYLKMLNYLRNEEIPQPLASLPINEERFRTRDKFPKIEQETDSVILRQRGNEFEDLTRMRPPLPQKKSEITYYNSLPDGPPRPIVLDHSSMTIESDAPRETRWKEFPEQQHVRTNNLLVTPLIRPEPFTIIQPSLIHQRSLLPSTLLLPPAPSLKSDYARYRPNKETNDYHVHAGNGLVQNRILSRAFRYPPIALDAIRRLHSRRRKRRSSSRNYTTYAVGSVKGAKFEANKGESNRAGIEPVGKNVDAKIRRNSRWKVIREVETKFVPDMSSLTAKQAIEKKSRYYGGVSRESLHKKNGVVAEKENATLFNGIETKNDETEPTSRRRNVWKSFDYNETSNESTKRGAKKIDKEIPVKKNRSVRNETRSERTKRPDEMSLESLHKESDVVAGRENGIALYGNEKNGFILGGGKEAILAGIGDALSKSFSKQERLEKKGRSIKKKRSVNEKTRTVENSEIELKRSKRRKTHDGLLNESPKVTGDIVEKELRARFNEDENLDESNDEQNQNVEVNVPEFEYVEELAEDQIDDANDGTTGTTEENLNTKKYPFYNDRNISPASALKYAVDPRRIPRKSVGRMEFYNSRDAYKHCDEVEPNFEEVIPKEKEPVTDRDLKENLPRLHGLGDKLDCFKAKYFDENPFDNPLFLEKEVEEPTIPVELNPTQITSRITIFPEENDEYMVQKPSKRPENINHVPRKSTTVDSTRFYTPQQSIRLDYKREPPVGRGRNVYLQNVRGPFVRNIKNSRRIQKPQTFKRRPASTVMKLMNFYSPVPYQSQVYEDVMGNIKHLANSYKVHEVTTSSPSTQILATAGSNVKTRTLTIDATSPTKAANGHVPFVNVTENPNNLKIFKIKGLMPPIYLNRHPTIYIRKTVKGRPSLQKIQLEPRIIGHYQTIKIHKRNIREAVLAKQRNLSNLAQGNEAPTDVKNNNQSKRTKRAFDLEAEETVRVPIRRNKKFLPTILSTTDSDQQQFDAPKHIPNVHLSSANKEQMDDESQRVIYTIRDRIKYSRPKGEHRKVRKIIPDETSIDVDHRRKEPRYNSIKRRRPQESSMPSTTPTLTEEDHLTSINNGAIGRVPIINQKTVSRNQPGFRQREKSQHIASSTEPDRIDSSEKPETSSEKYSAEYSSEESLETNSKRTTNDYDSETVTTAPKLSDSKSPAEISKLRAYLESDPPGYTDDTASEEITESSRKPQNGSNDTDTTNVKVKENIPKDDNDTPRNDYRSYNSQEESSEKLESDTEPSPVVETQSEESTEDDGSKQEQNFNSRPSSPAESFEDDKFSDLGSRINKPEFHHPPFRSSGFGKLGSSEEFLKDDDWSGSDMDGEEKEHFFPWFSDIGDQKDNEKNSWFRGGSMGKYEFPWDRRERLAREGKIMKDDKIGKLSETFDDNEDDGSFEIKNRKNNSPWNKFDNFRRHDDRHIWRDSDSNNDDQISRSPDSEGGSSEHQPMVKYSSKYNSKNFKLTMNDKPKEDPLISEEINESIKKENVSDTTSELERGSSHVKKLARPTRTRGISRGLIDSENVTVVPKRRHERKRNSFEFAGNLRKSPEDEKKEDEAEVTRLSKSNFDSPVLQSPAVSTGIDAATESTKQSNYTREFNKKRRRPFRNYTINKEDLRTTTREPRNRRRQRLSMTTPATIMSNTLTTVSSTSASRVVRKKNQNKINDLKQRNGQPSTSRDNSRFGANESEKKSGESTFSGENIEKFTKNTNNNPKNNAQSNKNSRYYQRIIPRDESMEANDSGNRGNFDRVNRAKNIGENNEPETEDDRFSSEWSPEDFNFKEDEVKKLNDFGIFDSTPDDDVDKDFGRILKTDVGFKPPNGAVQLSQQGSREILSSVSWMSENYNF